MSIAYRVRDSFAARTPVLFWTNRDPFVIASQSVAHSGNVAIVRAKKTDLKGAPMVVKYIGAKASHVIAWQAMVKNNPFNTTSLQTTFNTGHTVIFQTKDPITYQNSILRDGNYDIDQDIFTYGNAHYKAGFDYWEGVMRLIIIT